MRADTPTGAQVLTDDALLTALRRHAVPAVVWDHAAHLRVAYLLLRETDLQGAARQLAEHIRGLNKAHGTPETPSRGYHHTLTCAWLALVADAMALDDPAATSLAFLAAHPHLGNPTLPKRCFSAERLRDPRAKTGLTPPDLAPLPGVAEPLFGDAGLSGPG